MTKSSTKFGIIWLLLAGTFVSSDATAQFQLEELLELKNAVDSRLTLHFDLTSLLKEPQVLKEIEASAGQVVLVQQMVKDFSEVIPNHYKYLRTLDPEIEERAKANALTLDDRMSVAAVFKQSLNDLDQSDKLLEQVFLPHQIRRLRQLVTQKVAGENGSEVGMVLGLLDQLGLSPAEKEELGKSIKKFQEEYFQAVEQLRDELNEKLVASLSPDQRSKYLVLVGNRFDFEKESRKLREEVAREKVK